MAFFPFPINRTPPSREEMGGSEPVPQDLVMFRLLVGNPQVIGDPEHSENAVGA